MSRYRQTMSESLSKVRGLSEKNDHEISMARSELEAISDKALKLSSMLQGKSDSDQLEAWVQSKITKAKDYINSVSDYMEYTPDMAMEKFDMKKYKRNEDENEHSLNALELVKMFGTPAEKKQMQGIYNAHMKRGHITPVDLRQRDKLNSKYYSKLKEDVDLNEFGLEGTITDKQLQNLKKVWSKKTMRDVTPGIKAMLKKLDAPTRAAIAHANINVISKIVPEEVELEEFNDAQVAMLKKSYADMKGKRISLANADKLRGIFNKFDGNASALEKLVKADIPFVSDMAISRLISKHKYNAGKLRQLRAGYNEDFTFDLESLTEQEDDNSKDKEIISKEQEISSLKSKLELEKQKSVQKQTNNQVNPETGEPLLKIGVAYKHLKDKMAKEKAAEDDRKEKKSAEMKDKVSKIKDKLKESINLDESDASDKAKMLGLTYMKFGRYGKDGKVTHISKGGQLVKSTGDKDVDNVNKSLAKARGDKKASEPKKEPAPKPKIDKFDAQKDLEKEVTDGQIDVEDDDKGGLSMSKEYEPSQDSAVENDAIAIKDYLMDKGVDEDDIYIDVEGGEDDEYLQLSVQVRAPKEEKDFSTKQIKQAYGIANDPRYKGGNYSGAVKAINKLAPGLADHPDVQKVLKRTNEDVNEADLSKSQIKMVHKKADELPKKDFKSRYGKDGDSVRYAVATNIVKKKQGIEEMNKEHPAKAVYEQIAGLKKKAEKSGMPYSILKKVYDRGMAAWRGGHRPGTTQQQWAFARVNSFVTKSSGTWGGADKDLAKQVKGSK